MNTGKWLILGIFALAFAGGAVGWTYRYYSTDDARRLWGTRVAVLIANAPQATALHRIRDVGETEEKTIQRAPGITNIRHSLLHDGAFLWDTATSNASPPRPETLKAEFGLRFTNGNDTVEIWFNNECRLVWVAKADAPIDGTVGRLNEANARNLRSFFEEQFPPENDAAG